MTVQLISAAPERNLWAQRFHREVDDVFEITTDVARSVAAEIAVNLSDTEQTFFSTARRVDAEAYDAYLRGRFAFDKRSYDQARTHFQRAIELDPDFALPYTGLANTIGSATVFGILEPKRTTPIVQELADTALRVDSTIAEAHIVRAAVDFYLHWDWAAAEHGAQRALALNSSAGQAYLLLAEVYSVTGRHEAAFAAVERARELDPLAPVSQFKPALILYLMRDYRSAIDSARSGLETYPKFWRGRWLLCLSLAALGDYRAAISECETTVADSDRTAFTLGALGYVYARAGRKHDAERISAELRARSQQVYVGSSLIAVIDGALGNYDRAFSALEQAREDHDTLLVHMDNYEFFDPLRSDPRFEALRH